MRLAEIYVSLQARNPLQCLARLLLISRVAFRRASKSGEVPISLANSGRTRNPSTLSSHSRPKPGPFAVTVPSTARCGAARMVAVDMGVKPRAVRRLEFSAKFQRRRAVRLISKSIFGRTLPEFDLHLLVAVDRPLDRAGTIFFVALKQFW